MRTHPIFLLLLLISINGLSQINNHSAVISGKILFEKDSAYSLRPYSIIIKKEWPISYQEYEQKEIDTVNYSFHIPIDLDQISYGTLIVNFFPDIDSTAYEKAWPWGASDMPAGFRGSEYAGRILASRVRFVVESGDSIHVIIDYNKSDENGRVSVHFSGSGGANNNLLRSMDLFDWYSESFKMPLDEGLSHEDLIMKDDLERLNEAKDSLSDGFYNLLKTDIRFENVKMKHALIRASLYGSEMDIEEKRAIAREYYSYLDTLSLRPEYLNSRVFRNYLGFYLEYLNRIITGKDIPYGQNKKGYWLAKAVFDEEILKTFLYERLAFQMETPYFYINESSQYKEFVERFPDTPESFRLTKLYAKHFPVSNGQLAPELELVDSTGRKKDLSDLRGKVVIISSGQAWLDPRYNEKKIGRIQSLRKRFGDDLVMIALDLQYWESSSLSEYIDYYVSKDQNLQNLYAYTFLRTYSYNFIVRKNGMIDNCDYELYDLPEEAISGLTSEKYSIITRLKRAAEEHFVGVVIFLSVLISLILILLLISKLRQRRQELIQRQLNSELKALRSQLNPHFLFNSLNSIQNFINKSDAKTANLHLTKFALLMRRIIELSEKESTTLKEELDFNKTYVELEQLRYGFTFNLDINKSVDIYSTEIPSIIIQPFVENAIVHCMAELGEKGELSIFVDTEGDDKIYIGIEDNGKGFPSDTNKGFGLKSSRERIDLLNSQNKEKIDLFIESPSDIQASNGTTVKLIIPKKY